MDEFAKTFCEKLKDELHDVIAYGKLYDELEAAGKHHDAEIIEEIARDECEHAYAIKSILDRHRHYEMDAEVKALWDEAARAFEEEDYD